MTTLRPAVIAAISFTLGFAAAPLSAEMWSVSAEPWSTVFGGAQTAIVITVTASEPASAALHWSLAAQQRVVLRGEQAFDIGPDHIARLRVPWTAPEVRTGIVARLDFAATATAADGRTLASLRRSFTVFPADAFADRRARFRAAELVLFDPERRTADLLTAADVAFHAVRSVDELAALSQGVVLVGEGVSGASYRGLWPALLALGARGVPVLMLAPAEGRLALPLSDADPAPRTAFFALRGDEVLGELDKRLGTDLWADGVPVRHTGLRLEADRGAIALTVADAPAHWALAEMRFGRAPVIVCAFDTVRAWDVSPAPRYLFVKLLEHVMDTRGHGSANPKGE